MNRPYFHFSLLELEKQTEAGWNDRTVISTIIHECMHRRSPGAGRLKERLAARLLSMDRPPGAFTTPPQTMVKPHPSIVATRGGRAFDLYRWQAEALNAWRAAGRRGIVEAVTGAGKTVLGITAIREHVANGGRATVVVPTIELMNQWEARLQEHLPGLRIARLGDGDRSGHGDCHVLIASVHSGSRYIIAPEGGASLIVADEVHRLAAEKFSLALEENFQHRLGLSATWQRNDERHEEILRPYFGSVVFQLSYTRARSENAICPFRFAMIGVPLTDEEQGGYDAAGFAAGKWRRKLIHQFGAPDTNDADFFAWVQKAKNGNVPGAEKAAGMYWSAITKQRGILAECQGKQQFAVDVVHSVKAARRTIAFTMTIDAAENIKQIWRFNGVKVENYHSKLSSDSRVSIMARFRQGQLAALIAPKVLDEGVDVPDADLGLILATSRSRIQLIQRVGRVLRRKEDGRTARIALLYAKGTTEDPERGAHSSALADIEAAAEEFDILDALDGDMIADFLDP